MSVYAYVFIIVQACLVQNAYNQYLCGSALAGPLGWENWVGPALGYGLGPVGYECAAYGGSGVGNVAVAGEMGVAGRTLVAGQVPILGAVEFGGIVPAAGAVSIAGGCAGGCNGPVAVTTVAAPYGAACAPALASPCAAIPAASGGGFGTQSASAYPTGVSVVSENAIEGPLAVAGALPFLGTVALEGVLPTAGAGAVNYACGNGAIGIIAEDITPGIAGPFGYGVGPLAIDRLGFGLAGPYGGCGCGRFI